MEFQNDILNPKTTLFKIICDELYNIIDNNFLLSIKTEKGNTQSSERVVISRVKQVLEKLNLTYEEAGSQQSKDFRNVGGIGLDIEIKKTDSNHVYFNDTCPTKNINYIIFFTGKTNKRKRDNDIKPQLLFINGQEFIKDSPWIDEYCREIDSLKNKYARGENKKRLSGVMEVYPRPTFKANITSFLNK